MNRYRSIREGLKLTQEEIACYLGITRRQVYNIEAGVYVPSRPVENIYKLLYTMNIKAIKKVLEQEL